MITIAVDSRRLQGTQISSSTKEDETQTPYVEKEQNNREANSLKVVVRMTFFSHFSHEEAFWWEGARRIVKPKKSNQDMLILHYSYVYSINTRAFTSCLQS